MPSMNVPGLRVLPVFKYKANAYLAQLNPTLDTYYTLLDITSSVRLLYLLMSHNDTGTPSLTVKVTIDGEVFEATKALAAASTPYYCTFGAGITCIVTMSLDNTTRVSIGDQVPLEGHSVKIEIKTVQALAAGKYIYGAAIYEVLSI